MNADPNTQSAGNNTPTNTQPVIECYDMANDPGDVLVRGGNMLLDLNQTND